MATFILVHGASLGGWCWRKVVPLLEDEGHRVFALDLPGHGDDSTAVSGMTLDANVARIREAVEAADEPVILVGHSMGGIAITQAAEEVPDGIATLVYLAALLPQDGQSLRALAQSVVDPFFRGEHAGERERRNRGGAGGAVARCRLRRVRREGR